MPRRAIGSPIPERQPCSGRAKPTGTGRAIRLLCAGCAVVTLWASGCAGLGVASPGPLPFTLSAQTSDGWLEAVGTALRLPVRLCPWTGVRLRAGDRIQYRVYLAGHGWSPWRLDGACGGCTGGAITAVQVRFADPIRYRVHLPDSGWQAWQDTGIAAGQVDGPSINGLEIERGREPFYPRDRLPPMRYPPPGTAPRR